MKKTIITIFLSLILITGINLNAYGFGFQRNKENVAPNIGMYKNVLEGTNSYYVGNADDKVLYLTFDAGYDNGNMGKILDVLKEKDVKGTFFLTGDFFRNEDLVMRIANEGHIVANHTENHRNITTLTKEQIKEELDKVSERYHNLTGKEMVKYFRPPEGEFDKESLNIVKSFNYKTFFWSVAYNDWNTDKQKGADYGYTNIMNNLHNGAIILLHSVSSDNAACLSKVIDDARALGYEFRNLDQFRA